MADTLRGSTAPVVAAIDFESIYVTHFDYVWLTLRRLGILEADLPDVAHDVFVTVHRRLHDYDASRSATAWLFGIALRTAANHRRRVRRRREVATDHDAEDGAPPPVERLAQQRSRELVATALDQLPEDQRAVFVLHELEGRAAPLIARDLDVSVNTVYSRLRLAHKRFAKAVERLRRKEEGR